MKDSVFKNFFICLALALFASITAFTSANENTEEKDKKFMSKPQKVQGGLDRDIIRRIPKGAQKLKTQQKKQKLDVNAKPEKISGGLDRDIIRRIPRDPKPSKPLENSGVEPDEIDKI